MKILPYCFAALLAFSSSAFAKQFEIFDGQIYNGLYYPMVDIIEWGEQDHELPHIEFHVHSKDKPVDVSVVSGEKGGRPVLWIMYDLKYRNEHICRHVLAPAHFKEGQKLFLYRDNSDADYDNIYIYSQAWTKKGKVKANDYTMPNYERCTDEQASNMPEGQGAAPLAMPTPATAPTAAPAMPTGSVALPRGPASISPTAPPPREGNGLKIDYDNTAVPFSF